MILRFGLVIGYTEHLQNVTTNNYDSLTELHTPKITIITAHIKYPPFALSSLVVAWWRISTMSSAFLLTFLRVGDCLTTNSLLKLSTVDWLSLAVLLITTRHGPYRKLRSSVCCLKPLLSNGCSITAFSLSLPSNTPTCQFMHDFVSLYINL
jgi:hypothetical protein